MTREEKRRLVRQHAERHGLKIERGSLGGFRIVGRNGLTDFKVMDLADVRFEDLNPRRWA